MLFLLPYVSEMAEKNQNDTHLTAEVLQCISQNIYKKYLKYFLNQIYNPLSFFWRIHLYPFSFIKQKEEPMEPINHKCKKLMMMTP